MRKVNSTVYSCIYCSLEKEMTVESFLAHLDTSHRDLSDTNKKELIKDIKRKISLTAKAEEEEVLFNEYKSQIISILQNSGIKETKIEQIRSAKKIQKLKKFLNSTLKQKFKDRLDSAGIDYSVQPKKEKWKKKKVKMDSKYCDETLDSIKPIYTPMGNKK